MNFELFISCMVTHINMDSIQYKSMNDPAILLFLEMGHDLVVFMLVS